MSKTEQFVYGGEVRNEHAPMSHHKFDDEAVAA